MSFPVLPGSEASKARLFKSEIERLRALGGSVEYPLNGGSETRRETAFDLIAMLDDQGAVARRCGGCFVVGVFPGDLLFLLACIARFEAERVKVEA